MTFKSSVAYGRGTVHIDDDDGDLLLGADELIELIDAPGYQPPVLPAIALEIYQLARSPDLDLRQVLRLLERDPMVAARVLRVAQSPMYATRMPVTSLADALQRLGVEMLARIVLEVSAGLTLFRAPGYEGPMEQVRRHSTATAYLARAVAHATKQPTEPAFLCGLLHDVGIVASLLVFARHRRGRPPPRFEDVWPVVEPLHETVSDRLARLWNLPDDVRRVIGHHHLRGVSAIDPLAGAVFVGGSLATELGCGLEHVDEPVVIGAVRDALGFPPAAFDELTAYGRSVIAQLA